MQLQDALDRFLLQLEADGRSPHTTAQYRRHVRLFADWAATVGHRGALDDVDEQLVARFFVADVAQNRADGRPRKPGSANAIRTSLRVFLKFAHEAGWVARNSARLLRRAICSPSPPRAFNENDLEHLMVALDRAETDAELRDRVLFRFLLHSGTRISSALGLRVDDLDLCGGFAYLRGAKRGRDDRIVLGNGTVELLRAWLSDRRSARVFDGISPRHAQRRLSQWLARAGITRHYSLHCFRHTFATALYAKTGDVLLVKEALRHTNVSSTLVYASCPTTRIRDALEACSPALHDLS